MNFEKYLDSFINKIDNYLKLNRIIYFIIGYSFGIGSIWLYKQFESFIIIIPVIMIGGIFIVLARFGKH